MRTRVDGEHFDALMAELDQAAAELIADAERAPERWVRGRPGKWTVGQHAAHVVLALAVTADAFEAQLEHLLDGSLGPAPRRGPLQWLWVSLLVRRATLPRGVRTPRRFEPTAEVDRATTIDRLRREVERHRALGMRLDVGQRDRLWAQNPFLPRWHYTFPEIIRVQAVHVRHHRRMIAEIG